MADENTSAGPLPVVDWLKLPSDADPYLESQKCTKCAAHYLGERKHCAKCGGRDCLEPNRLANHGTLYVYSIVHRSFPGIEVPYVSAIVDLEGGGTVKGNLIGVDPDPEKIPFGMPVDVVYKDALGRKDKEGHSYISYFFQPAQG